MKLIFEYHYSNGVDFWTTFHTFDQFESKDDLIYYLLDLSIKTREFSNLLNVFLSYDNEIEIEGCVFTIDEWFQNKLVKI